VRRALLTAGTGILAATAGLLATGCNNGQSSTAPNGGLDAGGQSCEYVSTGNNNGYTVKVLLDGISYCAEGSAMLKDYGANTAPVLYAPVPANNEVCSLTQQTIHIRVYNVPNSSHPASGQGAQEASILCSSLRNNGWR